MLLIMINLFNIVMKIFEVMLRIMLIALFIQLRMAARTQAEKQKTLV